MTQTAVELIYELLKTAMVNEARKVILSDHPGSRILKRLEAAENTINRLNTEREVVRELLGVLKDCDEDESHMALDTIHEAVAKDFDGKLSSKEPNE